MAKMALSLTALSLAPPLDATYTRARVCRRDALGLGLGLLATLGPRRAVADGGETEIPPPLAIAYFTSGDPRLLQPALDEVKYLGVVQTAVGSLRGADGDMFPALRVECARWPCSRG